MQDADGFPPGAEQLRDCIQTNDAFVISSPEYNASMPGGLKNSIAEAVLWALLRIATDSDRVLRRHLGRSLV